MYSSCPSTIPAILCRNFNSGRSSIRICGPGIDAIDPGGDRSAPYPVSRVAVPNPGLAVTEAGRFEIAALATWHGDFPACRRRRANVAITAMPCNIPSTPRPAGRPDRGRSLRPGACHGSDEAKPGEPGLEAGSSLACRTVLPHRIVVPPGKRITAPIPVQCTAPNDLQLMRREILSRRSGGDDAVR